MAELLSIRDWTIRRKILAGFTPILGLAAVEGWYASRKLAAVGGLLGRLQRGEIAASTAQGLVDDARMITFAIVIGTLVSGLLVAALLARLIADPLEQLGIAAERVAQGDLTIEIRSRSRDEVGWLEHVMRAMVKNLRQMVGQITAASHAVASSASEISATAKIITGGAQRQTKAAEETAQSMARMATSIQSVAGNAARLAAYVDETSSSITQMSASIEQVARSSGALASRVGEASATIVEMTVSTDQAAKRL